MGFLIDKYKIKSVSDITFHTDIYQKLFFEINNTKDLVKLTTQLDACKTDKQLYECIKRDIYMNGMDPIEYKNRYVGLHNLFIYGPPGSGKKTLIRLLLEDIYNKSINNTNKVVHQIVGYGNSTEEKEIEQSNYHMIIEPENNGLDKYVMQEIVGDYAKYAPLMIDNCNTPFKIVLINNVDNLSQYAQKALRCTIEKYYKTCKFILCGYQASKVIKALRSRCHNIRVPRPSWQEINNIIFEISVKEGFMISPEHQKQIVTLSKRNIKTVYSLLDIYKSNYIDKNIPINTNIYTLSWIMGLEKIINIIREFEQTPSNKTFNMSTIETIRDILYSIFITNISGSHIITQLLEMITTIPFNPTLYIIITQLFGYYETRLMKGKKIVIHLEALLTSILFHIYQFKTIT